MTLEDGSLWDLDPTAQDRTAHWQPLAGILVTSEDDQSESGFNYFLNNTDDDEGALARSAVASVNDCLGTDALRLRCCVLKPLECRVVDVGGDGWGQCVASPSTPRAGRHLIESRQERYSGQHVRGQWPSGSWRRGRDSYPSRHSGAPGLSP